MGFGRTWQTVPNGSQFVRLGQGSPGRGVSFLFTTGGSEGYLPVMHTLSVALQALVSASVFFVWVVRYDNIIQEFKQYKLPDWLRDLVGILKLTFSLLLLIGIEQPWFAVIGGVGIAGLMACAVLTHLRISNPIHKMLPSLTLLLFSTVIALINYRLLSAGS
jgi:uncharacterized membrane protein YphA (DoxX/SURF4 family)